MSIKDAETRTLVTVWVLWGLSILIMGTRLVLGRVFHKKFTLADAMTVAAIFVSFTRIACTHVIVFWKTNNISPDLGSLSLITEQRIYEREIGSKLTLLTRSLYIVLLWLQKGVLLYFYRDLVKDLDWGRRCVRVIWVILVITTIPAFISTLTECRPFDHYWKVLAHTDKCVRAIVQLFVVGGLNLFTDLLLIVLPIPVLLNVHLTWKKRLRISFLFSVGIVIITVTAVRLPRTLAKASSETYRITWTTAEALAASFVANAPTLYAYYRHFMARRKGDIRRTNVNTSYVRRGPYLDGTTLTWGSDFNITAEPGDIELGPGGLVPLEAEQIQQPQDTHKAFDFSKKKIIIVTRPSNDTPD